MTEYARELLTIAERAEGGLTGTAAKLVFDPGP
jgi:hypothetical protein